MLRFGWGAMGLRGAASLLATVLLAASAGLCVLAYQWRHELAPASAEAEAYRDAARPQDGASAIYRDATENAEAMRVDWDQFGE